VRGGFEISNSPRTSKQQLQLTVIPKELIEVPVYATTDVLIGEFIRSSGGRRVDLVMRTSKYAGAPGGFLGFLASHNLIEEVALFILCERRS